MNNLQPSQNDLQLQIGEYLASMMHQIDNKLGVMIQALANMENNVTQLHTRLNNLEANIYNPNKRVTKGNNQNHDMDDDSELKRKVCQARQEQELKSLLDRERLKWEQEQVERDYLIEQAKIEWETEKQMKVEKTNAEMFNYLN
jgi:hypothetical protein